MTALPDSIPEAPPKPLYYTVTDLAEITAEQPRYDPELEVEPALNADPRHCWHPWPRS
jgi:hypothetical protein